MPPELRLADDEPTSEHRIPGVDPLVERLIRSYEAAAAAQDRRHGELLAAMTARDDASAAREGKRDEQHVELVKSINDLTAGVGELAGKAPSRRDLYFGAGILVLLILVLLGLLAQSKGLDAGKAIDDARRAVPIVTSQPVEAGPPKPGG